MQPAPRLRMTTQRKVILDELKKLKTHPTAGELCDLVRRKLPRISLGTVYRNLEILSRTGHIQKIDVAGAEMRFDGDISDHYHVRCQVCGRVADVELGLIHGVVQAAQKATDFELTGHRVEFLGICPECRGEQAAMKSSHLN